MSQPQDVLDLVHPEFVVRHSHLLAGGKPLPDNKSVATLQPRLLLIGTSDYVGFGDDFPSEYAADGFPFMGPSCRALQNADDVASGAQLPRNTHPATAKASRVSCRRMDSRRTSVPHSRSDSCSRSKLSGHWRTPTHSTSVSTRLASRPSSSNCSLFGCTASCLPSPAVGQRSRWAARIEISLHPLRRGCSARWAPASITTRSRYRYRVAERPSTSAGIE